MSVRKVCPCVGCTAHDGSCPNLVDHGRCNRCRPDRGTTTEQGLGWQHQQNREQLIPAALGKPCPDCGETMTDPAQMVADHSTQDRRRPADRIHCRKCSDRQGGQLGHAAVHNRSAL
jgi:hypothetical protein